MKRTKKLLILLISVIALMSLMVLAVSAETVYAGSTITVEKPKVGNKEDMVSYNSSLSDTTVAEFVSTGGQNLKIHFLKPGTVRLTVDYTRWRPQAPKPTTGTCLAKTFTVIEPDKYVDNLKPIEISSDAFFSGGTFPDFSTPDGTNYFISYVTMEYDSKTYSWDSTLPVVAKGKTADVTITLKPSAGYYFAWGGTNDGQLHENHVYTVSYNGQTYKPYVVHDKCASEMKVTVKVPFQVQVKTIEEITVSDIDLPYHLGPLDQTATVSENVVFDKIKYTIFNKELGVYEKGDNVAIAVYVKSADAVWQFDTDTRAYWKERDVYSDQTVVVSPTEAIFVFEYKVEALDSQLIKNFVFTVDAPVVNGTPAVTAATSVDKYKVDSVTWSPADEKFRPGVAYTVKIEFSRNDQDYFFANDFKTSSRGYINGKWAELSTGKTSSGRFSTTKYYAEYTFDALEQIYVFPFVDCDGHWGYTYIEAAHQLGLLNGTSDTTYAPNTELTVAAAVKLAVCMNILYNGGDPNTDISVGKDVWYSTYMKYALDHGIIDKDLSSRQGEKITRSEYVYMFSRALPAEAFAEINNVSVGNIPDVKTCNTAEEKAIYKFYRAGIVVGNNKGEFMPGNTISRAEVATILVRMMDTSYRIKK